MSKIKVKNPIIELDGDEMARVIWNSIKKKIILPYLDIEIKYYDLSIENRDKTSDQITIDCANAIKKIGVGIKCATITPDESRVKELSLFLILNENIIDEQDELSKLFDHVLENNKFEKEIKNLIIFKKALFQSNFVNESELLETVKPLINSETVWRPHALLLLGDYFTFKKEYFKAKEFYMQILSLKNLHKELYNQARSQLIFITND